MIRVEQSVTVNRPVEEVFAFVADQTNAPRWQSGLLEVRRMTDGPLGVGTQHTFVRKFLGRRLEASNEYGEYEPNKTIAFKSTSGPMDFRAGYRTEPIAGGTKLTSWIEMQPKGFAGLAEPLIAASLRRELAANLGELKELLERGVVAVSS
ncbi:MAG: SRPBCC family protein [Ardenticatenaceae bacterium]|nr:SRPBCC family protein [Ardenticatenaceae bacterium]